jgi:predicted nucleic acid-binding protein
VVSQDEDHVADPLDLFERYAGGLLVFHAPTQIRFEVPSAITVATQRQQPRLSVAIGGQAIEKFLAVEISLAHDDRQIRAAYPLAHRYGCALHDSLYLALAQRLGIPLVTADDKLYQRIKQLREVVWIADYRQHATRSSIQP